MNNLSPQQRQYLRDIIPVVRGALARRTGNPDIPYETVVCRYGRQRPECDCPSLELEVSASDPKEILRQVEEAIRRYQQEHNCNPKSIQLGKHGFLTVANDADSRQPLTDRVALVTGPSGAIGYGVCKGLLENGSCLVAADLAGEKLDRLVHDLDKMAPGRVQGVALDVTSDKSIADALDEVILRWGGVDILVHVAGIAMAGHLRELDMEEFSRLEEVNVKGTLLILRAVSELLIRQATGGDIVIMSSKTVPSPGAGFGGYSATKAACHQLGRIASVEFAPCGIRVNMVAPDAVFSEGGYTSGLWEKVGPGRMKARGLDEKGLQDYYRQRNLLKAQITGRHVANAVLFFVTRQTPTTGATIPVDGGLPDATPR